MSIIGLNKDKIETIIKHEIQAAVLEAAEPAIQEAIKNCEADIRKRVAVVAMTYAERFYQVNHHQDVIQIRIGLNGNEINS